MTPQIAVIAVDWIAIRDYLAVMSDTLHADASRRANWLLVVVGLFFGALLAIACGLWVYYGSAVFFEILRAGIAACF